MIMLERDLERHFAQSVKRLGGVCYKLDARTHRGAPDRVVLLPGRGPIFVELKTDKGILSANQMLEHDRIRTIGGTVLTLYGKAEIDRYLDNYHD